MKRGDGAFLIEIELTPIGIPDGIYAMLSSDDMKETIGRLGQNASDAGDVSHDAIDQLAAMLLQRMSDLKG